MVMVAKQKSVRMSVLSLMYLSYKTRAPLSWTGPNVFDDYETPIKERSVVNIHATAEQRWNTVLRLLAACTHSGYDTAASCFDLDKGIVLMILQARFSLSLLCDINAAMPAAIEQAAKFMAAWYGQSSESYVPSQFKRCGYDSAKLLYTIFFTCQGGVGVLQWNDKICFRIVD